ncbi:hypothetical protein N7522_006369 [Penicillium canescens]|nr:hypothetical protein N7522_006369 [Penicillium canescens]
MAPGTITRDKAGHQTTIDLFFESHHLSERFLASEISHECLAHSYHLPIRIILDIRTTTTTDQPKRRNWKAMETGKFDRANYSFTDECKQAIKTTRRLFRRYTTTHDEDDWEEYKSATNRKGRVIKKALWTGFREFVKEAVSKGLQGLWRMVQWASNRGQEPDKVAALRNVFFLAPPTADLPNVTGIQRENQMLFPPITEQELADAMRNAMRHVPRNKAPGADGIPKYGVEVACGRINIQRVFISTIFEIFNACLRIDHKSRHSQILVMVTLRTAGPGDYRLPMPYRPVALLNTLGKILEKIIATWIAWAVEDTCLILTSVAGRADHANQLMHDRVHTAWEQGQK